jgi:uncharacterized membrane protein
MAAVAHRRRRLSAHVWVSILLCVALVGYGLVREPDWQNAVRRAMGMPPVATTLPFLIAIVSAPVALLLIGIAGFFNALAMLIAARLAKIVPRRIALLSGFGLAAVLFWSIGSGLLLRTALHGLDSSYRRIDALLAAELSAPVDPLEAGSNKSLISMLGMLDHLRRTGFIHSGHLMQPIVVDRVEVIIPAIVAAAEEIDTSGNEIPSVIDKMCRYRELSPLQTYP